MQQAMEWSALLSEERIRTSVSSAVEMRDQFERDRGRVLYSSPVRRLKDKAQVFPLEARDGVRTRLAHSLEVSEVARNLAHKVASELAIRKYIDATQIQSIETIASTCGLIHDLGNPPFGHAGELAIATWFADRLKSNKRFFDGVNGEHTQEAQDFLKFEGNAQAFRLISHLQILADYNGLNLTFGTLSAACKYLGTSVTDNPEQHHELKKPGHFSSEAAIIKSIREKTGTGNRRNPITFLVEAADDIVYSMVDIEDGIKKGVLEWREFEAAIKDIDCCRPILANMKKLLDKAEPLLTGKEYNDAAALSFRTYAIAEMVSAVRTVFLENYDKIMQGDYHYELIEDAQCTVKPLVKAAKRLLRSRVYTNPEILKLEIRGRVVIHGLMTLFWEALEEDRPFRSTEFELSTTSYAGKIFLIMSENYRRVFIKNMQSEPDKSLYWRLQLICDQVSGMTDTHACRLHKELTNA